MKRGAYKLEITVLIATTKISQRKMSIKKVADIHTININAKKSLRMFLSYFDPPILTSISVPGQ
jgi:hypothetical protein